MACFGSDRGAASTDLDDHLRWAETRNGAALSDNLTFKINALNSCSASDDEIRDIFADLSVVIAQHAPRAECFSGDRGVTGAARQPHLDWAAARSREDVLNNLLWKTSAAMAYLDRAAQVRFFADMSDVIAKAAGSLAKAPAGVVWQLANITFKDIAPSQDKALRVDDMQADANGGMIRITALNDGECAPGAGVPGPMAPLQRFLFRWRFSRDVTRLSFPDRFDVILSIEADGNVPCLDLNPIMYANSDGRVLVSKLGGSRFLFVPNPAASHVGGPRPVEVATPESGLERGSVAATPVLQVGVWGFRGRRGMQLEAQYTYTLASGPPR